MASVLEGGVREDVFARGVDQLGELGADSGRCRRLELLEGWSISRDSVTSLRHSAGRYSPSCDLHNVGRYEVI